MVSRKVKNILKSFAVLGGLTMAFATYDNVVSMRKIEKALGKGVTKELVETGRIKIMVKPMVLISQDLHHLQYLIPLMEDALDEMVKSRNKIDKDKKSSFERLKRYGFHYTMEDTRNEFDFLSAEGRRGWYYHGRAKTKGYKATVKAIESELKKLNKKDLGVPPLIVEFEEDVVKVSKMIQSAKANADIPDDFFN